MKEIIMVGKVTPDSMLSASRLPAVLGLSKYRTPNDELLVSINAMNGQQRKDITNEAMTWGNELESIILRQTSERLQLADMKLDHPKPFFHPTLPLCCSLDGLADGRGQILRTDPDAGIFVIGQESIELDGYGVLEAKLTSAPPEDIPSLARGPIQLQAQMDIMGFKWGALATLYRGTEMRIFLFAPHQNTLDTIKQITLDFQNRLEIWIAENRIEHFPLANSKDADTLWPHTNPEQDVLELDDAAAEYMRGIVNAKKKIEEYQDDIDKFETSLKELLGDRTIGRAGGFEVRWPMRNYQAQPEKVTPAKDAYSKRMSTVQIKELK
jgi:predicted phage-related endonuclease